MAAASKQPQTAPRVDVNLTLVQNGLGDIAAIIEDIQGALNISLDANEILRERIEQYETQQQSNDQELRKLRKENTRLQRLLAEQTSDVHRSQASEVEASRGEVERLRKQSSNLRRVLHDLMSDRSSIHAATPSAASMFDLPLNRGQADVLASDAGYLPQVGNALRRSQTEPLIGSEPVQRPQGPGTTSPPASDVDAPPRMAASSSAPVGPLPDRAAKKKRVRRVKATVDVEDGTAIVSEPKIKQELANSERPAGDPWDTDVTYEGPVLPDEEPLHVEPEVVKKRKGKEKTILASPEPSAPGPALRPASVPSASDEWTWQLDGLPSCSTMQSEPLESDYMFAALGLRNDQVSAINEMFSAKFHDAPLQRMVICKDEQLAFVADPVGLEKNTYSCFINWAPSASNDETRHTIWEDDVGGPLPYHTFISRPHNKLQQWWYVGQLEWSLARIPSKWPTHRRQEKDMLARALQKRWHSTLEVARICKLIETGKFEQFCIKLANNDELERASVAYVRSKQLYGF